MAFAASALLATSVALDMLSLDVRFDIGTAIFRAATPAGSDVVLAKTFLSGNWGTCPVAGEEYLWVSITQ